MAGPFLLPGDVDAASARLVLQFLNGVSSAKALSDAVEIAGELDVGEGVALRILRQRDQLGGFTTLDQLYAVPYVGPERFTEIVTALSGQRPPGAVAGNASAELTAALLAQLSELQREVQQLRAALQPQLRLRIWSLQETIWLGQTANVLLQLTDDAGRPLPDQQLVLTTHWGQLQTQAGATPGPAVVLRTDEFGLAQLRLTMRTQAALSAAHRLALERAVVRLPLEAPWPAAAVQAIDDLVANYRAPGSFELREAIDVLFREHAASLQAAEHRGDRLAHWDVLPVALVGYVQTESGARGADTLAVGSHTLIVRDWLGAFLARFEATAANDGRLETELKRAGTRQGDARTYLNDALISVQAFVNTERGELGKSIRNRVAQVELQRFGQSVVAELPVNQQVDVLAGLQSASKTIGDGGLVLFTAVESARKDGGLKLSDADLSAVLDRVTLLEQTGVTETRLQGLRTELLRESDARTTERISTLETNVSRRLDEKADRRALLDLSNTVGQLDSRLLQLDSRVLGIDRNVETVNGNVAGLRTRVDSTLQNVGTRLDGIDLRLERR